MFNIAINTFKEIIRNKLLWLIVVFSVLLIIFSILLGDLTIWENQKIIIDFWIAMTEIFWIICVLFIWSQLLIKEIEWKTIFLLLSKPIKRHEFIIWKFLWFSMIISLVFSLMTIVYLVVLILTHTQIESLMIFSLFFIYLKLICLIGIVLFLSSFMSTILTIISSLMIYLLSHSFSEIISFWEQIKSDFLIKFAKILNILFPPFEAINLKDYIWSIIIFNSQYIILNTIHIILYIIVLLILCSLIFNRKYFEN